MTVTVSALYIYPIKSCRGVQVKSVRLDHLGPLYDRRFMVVDESGAWLSQRKNSRFPLITPVIGPTTIRVEAKDMPRLSLPQRRPSPKHREVEIWGKRGPAEDAGDEAAGWFSEVLQQKVRLVAFPEHGGIPVDPEHSNFEALTAFTDGFPLTLLSEASLADLNGRMQRAVPMNRFRPNIVVKGCEAFAEDGWSQVRIGDALLDVVKPCRRCVTTTVDQATAEKAEEPLTTLATYRTEGNRVYFGQNCIHHAPGNVRVGDTVTPGRAQDP